MPVYCRCSVSDSEHSSTFAGTQKAAEGLLQCLYHALGLLWADRLSIMSAAEQHATPCSCQWHGTFAERPQASDMTVLVPCGSATC